MADISEKLAKFDPQKSEKYDPGQIMILFDNRLERTTDDQFSAFQSYWTSGLYRLGWPSVWKPDLDPGNIRLIWYTVRLHRTFYASRMAGNCVELKL